MQPEFLKYTIDKLVHYVQDCKYNHFWFYWGLKYDFFESQSPIRVT